MGKIYHSIEELIGKTPLAEFDKLSKAHQCRAHILGKLEYFNPGGSVKDRAARFMIQEAELGGQLKPGSVIIEPTSGNTGVGLAAIAASKGYETIIVMPETMSVERRNLLMAHGAKLVLTEGKKGMAGAIEKANQLKDQMEDAWIAGQFENPANPLAHMQTTGPEIWEDTDGKVDIFVAGVGSGGTITGVGRYLRSQNPDVRIVAVEPYSSPVLSGGQPGPHGLQGIGAGFIPDNLDTSVYDEIIRMKEEDAYQAARDLSACEGYLVGISSGAALHAALQLGKLPQNEGKTIVALLPDTGERYLSTELFAHDYPQLTRNHTVNKE